MACGADLGGQWTLLRDDGNFGNWSVSLTDSAGSLSGSYSGTSFSGLVLGGTHAGNVVTLSVTAPGCQIDVTASVDNPCLLSGVSDCVGFSQLSNFVGVR